jgi:hypothetical protein
VLDLFFFIFQVKGMCEIAVSTSVHLDGCSDFLAFSFLSFVFVSLGDMVIGSYQREWEKLLLTADDLN